MLLPLRVKSGRLERRRRLSVAEGEVGVPDGQAALRRVCLRQRTILPLAGRSLLSQTLTLVTAEQFVDQMLGILRKPFAATEKRLGLPDLRSVCEAHREWPVGPE